MATTKISQFPTMSVSDVNSANDVLPIIDTNLGSNKKITLDNLGSSITASHAITASYATTASYALNGGSGGGGGVGTLQQVMASGSSTTIAITGSFISASNRISALTGVIKGNLEVDGDIHADNNIVGDGLTTIYDILHITASGGISASGDVITQKVGVTSSAGIGFGNVGQIWGNEDSDVFLQTDDDGEISFVKDNNVVFSINSDDTAVLANNFDLNVTSGSINVVSGSINVRYDLTVTGSTSTTNLNSSGSIKRKTRQVNISSQTSTGAGLGDQIINSSDDIIVITGSNITPLGGNYTFGCSELFMKNSTGIGRTVTIINGDITVGSTITLSTGGDDDGGDFTVNGVTYPSSTTQIFSVCNNVGDSITITQIGVRDSVIYGVGI